MRLRTDLRCLCGDVTLMNSLSDFRCLLGPQPVREMNLPVASGVSMPTDSSDEAKFLTPHGDDSHPSEGTRV